MTNARGWSLLEMLVVVALISSTLLITLPELQHWRHQWQLRSVTHQIQSTLHTARQEALLSRTLVTLCVLDAHHQCTSPWGQGPLAVFRDPFNNRQLSSPTQLITMVELPGSMQLSRHPSHMPWLQLSADGTPRGATGGHIRLCSSAHELEAVRFIIAAGGRSRVALNQGEPCLM
jgi:type IV fimbrial biogenesis protein FimT